MNIFIFGGWIYDAGLGGGKADFGVVTVAKGGNWCGELRPGFAVRKENPIRAEVIVELSPPMARL